MYIEMDVYVSRVYKERERRTIEKKEKWEREKNE